MTGVDKVAQVRERENCFGCKEKRETKQQLWDKAIDQVIAYHKHDQLDFERKNNLSGPQGTLRKKHQYKRAETTFEIENKEDNNSYFTGSSLDSDDIVECELEI